MKILSPGMERIGCDVDLARQRMEGIEDQPDVRMVRAAHDFPGVAMIVDVPAPGKRLVADAQAALGGAFAKLVKIAGRPIDAAERHRRDRWSRPASGRCRVPA